MRARATQLVQERFGTKTPSNAEIAALMVEFASFELGKQQLAHSESLARMGAWREEVSKAREIERLRGGGWG